MTATSYLILGDDASLSSQALSELLDRLCGMSFVPVEEHGAEGDEALDLGPVLEALATPPFLSDRRVVVLRGAERLDTDQAALLAARVKEPADSTVVVLVAGGGGTRSVPATLLRAVKAHGEVIESSPGQGRQRSDWVGQRIRHAAVHLDPDALRVLGEHLGEDVARLQSILDMLEAAYGHGSKVTAAQLSPFLGDSGSVPPWDLTDTLDRGDTREAVKALHRMMNAGGRHPLQIMASLQRHYGAMLRLDGAEVSTAEVAAGILKMSPYPARKALEQGRRLGHERIARAIDVIAQADADLRGRLGWPGILVMEVLVARLAQLARSQAAPTRRSR
ncbi:MAG: DNA polymerase III subunit delta [Acidimicrobiales bacterium]